MAPNLHNKTLKTKPMNKTRLIILALIAALSSCKKEQIDGDIQTDPTFAEALKSSPESLTIGNNNLHLTTYLYRDFMPVSEVDGREMVCINKLTEADSMPVSSSIALKKQYVIKGNEIWEAPYNEIRNDTDYMLEGVVTGGPKWGPHIEVDVVCEFEFSGSIHRILAKSQLINRTD